MYDEKLETLITAALADGVLTDKEKQILFKKAEAMGIDRDEFELVLNGRLAKRKKEMEAKSAQKKGAIPQELDDLIKEYLSDGIISTKERQVLLNKAQTLGLNLDEVDLYIDAQQQKADQAIASAVNKRRGKTCPYCGSSIPELTDKCPNCGGNITPEASEELAEIIEHLESALVNFKSGEDIDKSKAEVDRYARQARMYYGNNPKIQRLLDEIETESEAAEKDAKKRFLWNLIGRYKKSIVCGIGVLLIGIYYFYPNIAYNNALKKVEAINEQVLGMINDGNLQGAKSKLTTLSFDYVESRDGKEVSMDDFDNVYTALINAYIKAGDLDNAEEVALYFRTKRGNWGWCYTSCYLTIKKAFKKCNRDTSAIE